MKGQANKTTWSSKVVVVMVFSLVVSLSLGCASDSTENERKNMSLPTTSESHAPETEVTTVVVSTVVRSDMEEEGEREPLVTTTAPAPPTTVPESQSTTTVAPPEPPTPTTTTYEIISEEPQLPNGGFESVMPDTT